MATTETVAEKSPSQQAQDLAESRRHRCREYELGALNLGDHETSIRHALAQILCAGQYVRQGEGDDVTAERALLRYAAATTKAIGIALNVERNGSENHDVVLYDHEAAIGLAGLSALLDAAPGLIDKIESSGMDLRSEGGTCLKEVDDDEETDDDDSAEVPA
jgi:hypothetical protein